MRLYPIDEIRAIRDVVLEARKAWGRLMFYRYSRRLWYREQRWAKENGQ